MLRSFLTGLLISVLFACGKPSGDAPGSSREENAQEYVQTGYASWYGPGLNGRQTANGEQFDMEAMTAAHPDLPFNAKAKVTNLSNGQSVVVRINDRGPYAKNRIIDLSKAAAREIGMLESGTAKVRIRRIE